VDVTVVNPLGTSATGTVDKFTYNTVAAVSNISPKTGVLGGGTSVTITGSGFTGATNVLFGATPAASFTVVSDTQITAASPAATTAGTVDVTVVNLSGTSATGTVDKFTYTTVAAVANISPKTGVLGGGTSVTITGSGFTGATNVLFGTTPATSFTVVSDTQITAASPVATAAGAVDVTVVNLMGTSATSAADKFTYTLTVTGVSTTQATGSYGLIDTETTPIAVTVTFSGPVTVTGTPQLTLNTLDASGAANHAVVNYASGSGTNTLTFNYTIAAGQNSARLDYIAPPGLGQSALSLNGGTIQDAAGNAADLTSLPTPGAAADGLYAKNILINTVPPSDYAVTPNPTVYGNSNADSAGFTISGQDGELYTGDVYNYTISSTGGSGQVTGSGTVTSTTSSQAVSGIDLSALPNGTLTLSVTLTSVSGNIGAPATATASLVQLDITSASAATATVGQVFTYTVQTNAPTGDTVTVTPGTLPTGMTFDAATATFTWTPTADLAGTSPSFTATVKDTTLNNTATLAVYVMVAAANGLTVIAPAADIANGSPVLVAFNDANTGTPTYTVTTSSSSDPTGSNLTATLMPQTNQVLKILTDQGEMDIQLFDNYTPNTVNHFLDLVNAGTYTNTSFYRIIQDFMIQGGSGGTGGAIPVELNANLRFTSSGLLAMANNGVDGNTSEFFVTGPNDMSNGFLDFRYTIFGKLISGDNVRQSLAATPVTTNASSGEDSQPLKAPKILSMSVTTEQTAGVVMLQAAPGANVGDTYTVTVRDGLGATQTFQIHIGFNGPFQLQVGSTATGQMQFDSSNPAATAANMQSALQAAGLSGATVAVAANSTATSLGFTVTFPTAQPAITATTTDLPVTFSNSVTTSATSQVLTFNVTGTGAYDPPNPWVQPINSTDTIYAAAGTPVTFTPQGESAAGVAAPQVNVELLLDIPTVPGAEVDTSFLSSSTAQTYPAQNPNQNLTLTNNGTSYTVTPTAGYYGVQLLEVTAQSATAAPWDSLSSVDPVYRAIVPVYVAPPAPVLSDIKANGQTLTGTTSNNNSSTATELSFDVTGAIAGATVSVYMDGGTTAIATGTVATGSTTITVTTDGTTLLGDGAHTFTVKQSVPTETTTAYVNWGSNGPSVQFSIPASSVVSAASSGVALTIDTTIPLNG